MSSFTGAEAEAKFKELAAASNIKPGEVLQLFRVMVSGLPAGVDLFPMVELLGNEEVSNRINKSLSVILNMAIAKS